MLTDPKKISAIIDRIFYAASGFCCGQSNNQKKSRICETQHPDINRHM